MGEFRMPSLGADMDAGTLIEWHVGKGARVKRGDIVALVETQKGLVEIEIWESGVITDLLVPPGTKVPVGTVLAMLQSTNGASAPVTVVERAPAPPPPPQPPPPPPPAPVIIEKPATVVTMPAATAPATAVVRASPSARQLARERGVDLTKIQGTGPHDAVTRRDVERASAPAATVAAAATAPEPAPTKTTDKMAAMRKAIAAAMARSKREIPHYYLGADLDVSRATRWLEAENARRSVTERIVFAAVLLKATALALRQVPELNGFFLNEGFRRSDSIHVGVAIALRGGGLVAPALHDTDKKTLPEIMAALQDLVARARTGSLRSSEMSDPTITVTNLGDQGTDSVFGVIYPPQVAIVGFGKMRDRPWAVDGMLAVRSVITASLAADHRVSDGHRGGRFLAAIEHLLNEPEKL